MPAGPDRRRRICRKRTERQTTKLVHTAVTLEEVTEPMRNSADRASESSGSASNAQEAAESSRTVAEGHPMHRRWLKT